MHQYRLFLTPLTQPLGALARLAAASRPQGCFGFALSQGFRDAPLRHQNQPILLLLSRNAPKGRLFPRPRT